MKAKREETIVDSTKLKREKLPLVRDFRFDKWNERRRRREKGKSRIKVNVRKEISYKFEKGKKMEKNNV